MKIALGNIVGNILKNSLAGRCKNAYRQSDASMTIKAPHGAPVSALAGMY